MVNYSNVILVLYTMSKMKTRIFWKNYQVKEKVDDSCSRGQSFNVHLTHDIEISDSVYFTIL